MIDITDANCHNSASGTVNVSVNPLPSATISGGGTICGNEGMVQIDITANGTPPYNVVYSDGFNNVSLNGIISPYSFQTNTTGNYTIISISDINCNGNSSGVANVVVYPNPIANFSFTPQPTDIYNPINSFTDLSSGHVDGEYDFGDGTPITMSMPGEKLSHTFSDTGSYQVLYIVTSADGCTSLVSHTIIIDPAFLFYIPTAFTPNRDGKNDVFIPIMRSVNEYNFSIYDRFGGIVFETDDQSKGWNGKVLDNNFALAGHYAYSVKIIDMRGKKRTFTGTLTLIR